MLIVSLHLDCCSFAICSFHAPYAGDDDDDDDDDDDAVEWWKRLTSVLKPVSLRLPILLLFDGNAQVGEVVCNVTGGVGKLLGSRTAPDMVECLGECGVWLPASFRSYCRDGPLGTFNTSIGEVQLDYVGCCKVFQVEPNSACTWDSFDMCNKKPDHITVALKLRLPIRCSTHIARRRKACYDRSSTSDPQCKAHFAQLLDTFPDMNVQVEPSSHMFIADAHVAWAATTSFGEPEHVPVQQYHTKRLVSCIKERGRSWRQFRRAGKKMFLAAVYSCFQQWAGKYWRVKYTLLRGFLQAWQPEQRALIQQYIDAQSVTITAYSDMQYAVWADERFISSKAALLSDDPHVFFAEAKKSKPQQIKATFRVCDSDGKPAKSYTAQQHILRDHFSKLLHG